MRVFITGEKGFIGTNLVKRAKRFDIDIISGVHADNDEAAFVSEYTTEKGEPCVYKNSIESWKAFFEVNEIDVIIHNAAKVGTDVVALNAKESTLTNVQGTYNICRAARALNIGVCYMGTTVIYDTPKYQNEQIKEESDRGPHTLYGCQKLCAEDIIKSQVNKWMIVRPLFAYGGEGDMNSLIAKTIYTAINDLEPVDMFLDPTKIKDYMHVDDYSDAVLTAIQGGHWYQDWNVAAETPLMTGEIVSLIGEITGLSVADKVRWLPNTDYTGNHMLSSWKFRKCTGWTPKISLEIGIAMSFESIAKSKGYNPLTYLEDAKARNIDLTKFY